MSVVQVFKASGAPVGMGPPPEDVRKRVEAVRAMDGCEHVYSLGKPGQALLIVVWRDQAALDASQAERDRMQEEARAAQAERGVTISLDEVYETFTEI
jgi:quinol monooxygenase YgiN